MKKILTVLILVGLALAGMSMLPSPATADLLVLPVRTVFKDRDRTRSVAIVNTSDRTALFEVSFYHMKQIESGGYEELEGPINPEYDLSKMIVFSPRRVELPAGGKQAVRMSLRGGSKLPDGEYRVHMKLTRINDAGRYARDRGEGVAAVININVGFSVPIMVRKGTYDATAKISDFNFIPGTSDTDGHPQVSLYLNREGKHSTLGKIDVYWTPAGGGEERHVGILNAVSVYSEINRRSVKFRLNEKNVAGGTLRVVYEGDDIDKGITFDEKVFRITG